MLWDCVIVAFFCTGGSACFYIGDISRPTHQRQQSGLFAQTCAALPSKPFHCACTPSAQASALLVLLVVVDLVVPEEGLRVDVSGCRQNPRMQHKRLAGTHLVTISPEVVLGPDVLEGVLGLVLERGAVSDVLPVLGPKPVGVDTGKDDGGDHDAVVLLAIDVGAWSLRRTY